MNALVDTHSVITIVVKMSVVIGVAALADVVLRRRASAATRHWLWTLAVAAVLALPVVSLLLPSWTVVVPYAAATSASAQETLQSANTQFPAEPEPAIERQPGDAASVSRVADSTEQFRPFSSWAPSLLQVVLTIYLVGLTLALARLLVQQWAAHRLIRNARDVRDSEWLTLLDDCADRLGVHRPVRLLRSRERSMPMAVGVQSGAILIPSIADTWTPERRRAVLLHELSHIGRYDCLTQLLAQAACALYWPHPGVWWAARRLRVERELACDDRVLHAGTEARDYAGHLLEIAYDLGSHHAPALAVSMARPSQLEGRMLAVLDAARNRATPGVRARLVGTVAATALLLPLAVIVATGEPLAVIDEVSVTDDAATAVSVPVPPPSPVSTHVRHDTPHAVAGQTPSTSAARTGGAWTVRTSDNKPGMVYLEMREDHSNNGTSVPIEKLEGLSTSALSADGPVRFAVRRDAGTFNFEGTMRGGVGGGVYSFAPNPAFGGELEKRGIGRPSADQQYDMARHDVGFALVDELASQGYPKPSLEALIQSGHHGVRLDYVREMGQLGYKVGSLEALIKMRDHGVSPSYVREMAAAGYTKLSADDLVRARDHGVSTEFVKEMKEMGYTSMSLDELVNARDHGVSAEFAREMGALGYKLSMEQMVKARDHGVSGDFVKEMAAAGYGKLPLDELINARDHGVSASYVKEMAALGYNKLSLSELVNARDHGVSASFARELRDLGYQLSLGELVNARDHGVSAAYIRDIKALGYDPLPLAQAVQLRDHGVSVEKIKRANEKAGTKLPLDMVRSMVDGGMR